MPPIINGMIIEQATTTLTAQYYYPNRLGRIILQSMRVVMGPDQIIEVLREADLTQLQKLPPNNLDKTFPFEWVAAIQAASELVFGVKGGRNINREVGRECLENGLKEFGPILGISDLPYRLMPIGMKLRVGLNTFATMFNHFSDQIVRIAEQDHHFIWVVDRNPVCWGRQTEAPCCHLALGILEEAIFWGTGGRRYSVEERHCIATGAPACEFYISKTPAD